MRRGLTLIELLVAVTLLAAIMSATSAWTQIAASLGASATEPSQIAAAAQAVLQLVQDDIAGGDFAPHENEEPARVALVDGDLQIRTRRAGPIIDQYRFERDSRSLVLVELRSAHAGAARLLVRGIESFDCTLDHEHSILHITIGLAGGQVASRRYQLP